MLEDPDPAVRTRGVQMIRASRQAAQQPVRGRSETTMFRYDD